MMLRIYRPEHDDSEPLVDQSLADAVRFNDLERVKQLINADADPNATGADHLPLVLVALRNENPAIARLLMDAGADLAVQSEIGEGPLLISSGLGYLDLVRRMIELGADVNQIANDYMTPLSAALQGGHWNTAELLKSAGAAVHHVDPFCDMLQNSYAMPGDHFAGAVEETYQELIHRWSDDFHLDFRELPGQKGIFEFQLDDAMLVEVAERATAEKCSIVTCPGLYERPDRRLLFPTDDKYPIIRAFGPFSSSSPSQNQDLIWGLVELEEINPFSLESIDTNLLDGRFDHPVVHGEETAELLQTLCPPVELAWKGDIVQYAESLALTNRFHLQW